MFIVSNELVLFLLGLYPELAGADKIRLDSTLRTSPTNNHKVKLPAHKKYHAKILIPGDIIFVLL
jgi:hypothetical protein